MRTCGRTVEAVSAAKSSPSAGEVMDETMFDWLGISPITMPLPRLVVMAW